MDKKTILLIFLIFLISIPQTSASEDIVIEYHRANLEGVGRYWFGQGELSASNLENPFTLRANGNEIISYSSNATLISLTENEIQFSSTEATNNHAHALLWPVNLLEKALACMHSKYRFLTYRTI